MSSTAPADATVPAPATASPPTAEPLRMPKFDDGNDTLEEECRTLLGCAFGGDASKATCCMAPGRVNLIGEHTDYNEGFVMPFALKLRTVAMAVPTDTGLIRIASTNQPGKVHEFSADDNAPGKVSGWGKYVAGVVAQYKGNVPEGTKLSFDATFASNVPLGAGLSSSASLEVVVATLLETLLNIGTDVVSGVEKALRCVEAEHTYAHVPCGIMDQYISANGKADHFLLIDCRTKEFTLVPFKSPDLSIVVCNTNVKHELSGSEYPDRVNQCKQAVHLAKEHFAEKAGTISHLRDLTPEMIEEINSTGKMEEVVYKRAKHGTTEDIRVEEAVKALRDENYPLVGQLMHQSHLSLKNDYEVSTEELDTLVDIAMSVEGVFGARMTGGGFGGSIVALVRTETVPTLMEELETQYKAKYGLDCTCFSTRPGDGARALQTTIVSN